MKGFPSPYGGRGGLEFSAGGGFSLYSPIGERFTVKAASLLRPNLQVGVEGTYLKGDNGRGYGIAEGIADYYLNSIHLMNANLVPYVGPAVGAAFGHGNTSVEFGGQGGLKYFFNARTAVFGELQYRRSDGLAPKNNAGLMFGISILK
jgi:hypothetical protein